MKRSIKNIFKAALALLLVFCCLIGTVACKPKEDDSIKVDGGDKTEKELPYTVVEDKYFIKDRKTDYVILAQTGGEITETAVSELQNFWNEASGVALVVYYSLDSVPEGKKIISLGETDLAASAGFSGVDMDAESSRIVTKDDNIYIVGNGWGILWGVYEFLDWMFNYTYYMEDCYSLNRNVKELNYITVDETLIPDITYVPGYHGLSDYNSTINAKRYRMRSEAHLMVGYYHNALEILPADKYINEHPNWYATTGNQLCTTARGNSEDYEAMVQALTEYFVAGLRADKTKSYLSFSMMDVHTWCTCPACEESKAKYGAESAAMLILTKKVRDRVADIMAAEGDTRDIKIVTMLYNASEDVPVKKNDNGEYVLTDASLDFTGVIPLWAAMSRKEHELSWEHPDNAGARDMLDKMNAAFDEIWIWDYGVNFYNYFVPYDIFSNIEADFKFLEQYNITMHLYQLDHNLQNTTGWGALKIYLLSELMWDCDQSVEELTQNFFENVYGAGAEAMKKIYDSYRVLAAYNSVPHGNTTAWDQSIYSGSILQEAYFPRGIVNEWFELLDEAYAAIEAEKSENINAYYTYETNIKTEAIHIRYIDAVLYRKDNNEENIEVKKQIYFDVQSLGFAGYKESVGIWDLAVALGIDQYLQ